jgi:hypothetical protein
MLPSMSPYAQFCEPTSKNWSPSRKSSRFFPKFQMRKQSISRVAEKPVYWTLIAVPVVKSRSTIGPLLRRGTIRTNGGMPPPGGTGTTVSGTPFSKFTRNSTGTGTIGSGSPR